MLGEVEISRHPERDRVMVLLSHKAGLRAVEISRLTWDMRTNPNGNMTRLAKTIVAKGGSLRDVQQLAGMPACRRHSTTSRVRPTLSDWQSRRCDALAVAHRCALAAASYARPDFSCVRMIL